MAVNRNILALDVGEKRVGVALANSVARLSQEHSTLLNSYSIFDDIKKLAEVEQIDVIVVGLPRSLSGDDTDQTRFARDFKKQLEEVIDTPIYFEDEALSSVRAKEALNSQNRPYKKEEVDALAAAYILDDFIANQSEVVNG